MRGVLTPTSTWFCVTTEQQKFLRWKINTDTIYYTLKTHTKHARSVCSRSSIKLGTYMDRFSSKFCSGLTLNYSFTDFVSEAIKRVEKILILKNKHS